MYSNIYVDFGVGVGVTTRRMQKLQCLDKSSKFGSTKIKMILFNVS